MVNKVKMGTKISSHWPCQESTNVHESALGSSYVMLIFTCVREFFYPRFDWVTSSTKLETMESNFSINSKSGIVDFFFSLARVGSRDFTCEKKRAYCFGKRHLILGKPWSILSKGQKACAIKLMRTIDAWFLMEDHGKKFTPRYCNLDMNCIHFLRKNN